jgi:hypothetical protein
LETLLIAVKSVTPRKYNQCQSWAARIPSWRSGTPTAASAAASRVRLMPMSDRFSPADGAHWAVGWTVAVMVGVVSLAGPI